MNDAWGWWLFFVGLGVGVAAYWLLAGRIRRSEDDVAADEQSTEASWISATIEAGGGEAPAELVAQVLELHRRYLDGDAPDLTPAETPQASPAGLSGGHGPDVQGDGTRGEASEAHLGEAG